MTIENIAMATGLDCYSIRLYEAFDLIQPDIELQDGKWRSVYSKSDVETLCIIKNLRKAFFQLNEIKIMMNDSSLTNVLFCYHKKKIERMAEERNQIIDILRSVTEKPESIHTLSKQLEAANIQEIPLPETDVYPFCWSVCRNNSEHMIKRQKLKKALSCKHFLSCNT